MATKKQNPKSSKGAPAPRHVDEDVQGLHELGYAQELARRMSGFSNFAISFSIICILAGGITAFGAGFSAMGGASIGIGWLVGGAFAMIVALSMGQIASAYPTAGGLYQFDSGRQGVGLVNYLVQPIGAALCGGFGRCLVCIISSKTSF